MSLPCAITGAHPTWLPSSLRRRKGLCRASDTGGDRLLAMEKELKEMVRADHPLSPRGQIEGLGLMRTAAPVGGGEECQDA